MAGPGPNGYVHACRDRAGTRRCRAARRRNTILKGHGIAVGATPSEANLETLRRVVEAINRRDFDEVTAHVHPGFVRHDLGAIIEGFVGPSGVGDFLAILLASMPDFRITIEQLWGADDRTAMTFRFTGTHLGEPLFGIEANGSEIDFFGVSLDRFEAGRIAEAAQLIDVYGLLRQPDAGA